MSEVQTLVHLATEPDEAAVRDAYLRVSHAFEGERAVRKAFYSDFAQFFTPDDLVLDFGCGDGTWLEVLSERGIPGVGIDYDPDKVATCHERGLDAICSDRLIDAAERRPTAITFLHIVEHLPAMDVLRFLMTLDVAKVLIVTPNIHHAPVQANFWMDITHVRPYPGPVLEQFCKQSGFPGVMSGTQNNDWDSWCFAWKPGTPGWPDPVVT